MVFTDINGFGAVLASGVLIDGRLEALTVAVAFFKTRLAAVLLASAILFGFPLGKALLEAGRGGDFPFSGDFVIFILQINKYKGLSSNLPFKSQLLISFTEQIEGQCQNLIKIIDILQNYYDFCK